MEMLGIIDRKCNKKVAIKPLLPGLTGLPLDVCSRKRNKKVAVSVGMMD
jgi:hypothetical protein